MREPQFLLPTPPNVAFAKNDHHDIYERVRQLALPVISSYPP